MNDSTMIAGEFGIQELGRETAVVPSLIRDAAGEVAVRLTSEKGMSKSERSEALSGYSVLSSRAPPVQSLHDVARIAEEMRLYFIQRKLVKDRKWHFKTYRRCFLHQDGLRWLTDQVLKLEDESGEARTTSMCSSFGLMELYLDEVKIKAAKLGNLMIKAGFIAHVCNDHVFDVNHSSKTLFFRFHITSCISRLSASPSPAPETCPNRSFRSRSMGSRNMGVIVEQRPSLNYSTGKAHEDLAPSNPGPVSSSTDELEVLADGDHSVHEINANPISDEVSVMTMLTKVSNASSDDSTNNLLRDAHVDRQVDIAVLSLARDFHSNFLLMRKIKDRTYHLKRYKNCYLHDDAMAWLSRQVRFHHHAARQSTQIQDEEDEILLSFEESEIVAAKLGNAMIHHGYITHVCDDHIFRPGKRSKLFFKFRTKLMERDFRGCRLGRCSETEIAQIQRDLFVRESLHLIESPIRAKLASGT